MFSIETMAQTLKIRLTMVVSFIKGHKTHIKPVCYLGDTGRDKPTITLPVKQHCGMGKVILV